MMLRNLLWMRLAKRKADAFEAESLGLDLIVWGLKDIFFNVKWAYWLKDTIPGARRVIEVEDGRLFFPEDRPDALVPPILKFWDESAVI